MNKARAKKGYPSCRVYAGLQCEYSFSLDRSTLDHSILSGY